MAGIVSILLWAHLAIGCASSEKGRASPREGLDIDSDGFVTPEEYAAGELSGLLKFEDLDTDRDGLLSESELEFRYSDRAQRQERGEGRRGGKQRGSRPNSI